MLIILQKLDVVAVMVSMSLLLLIVNIEGNSNLQKRQKITNKVVYEYFSVDQCYNYSIPLKTHNFFFMY